MSLKKMKFDFSQTEGQSLLIHSVRLAFLILVFVVIFAFQFLESRIVAHEAFYPLYTLMGISFAAQIIYLSFFQKLYKIPFVTGALFAFESFYITGLIYFIGIQQSVIIFLYLVNIILCGVLYQRKGALLLSLWTSILFSFIISLDTTIGGHTAYLAVGVNNVAFFTVAYLAGYLSEQLNVMGEKLEEKVRDVKTLRNLNELILSNMSSGLMTVDSQGVVVQVNPSALSILGVHSTEVIGQPVSQILPPTYKDLSELTNESFDLGFKKKGEKRLLRVQVSNLQDETGVKQGQVISFQDETHLRHLEKRLRQSEKMAAIGQLAAGIAHEIRNPLAGISGSIQLLQGSDSSKEESEKLMSIVMREINRLNILITEFLDFAKPEAPKEDQVALGALIEEIVEFTQLDAQNKDIAKNISCDEDIVILANRHKLRQAFLNIIVNAYQAMDNSEKPELSIHIKNNGKHALVSIKDNGMGMSEELRERIFEPFHTTKHKGTGLGLAITHSIFESHNAEVQVESEVGEGTQFNIRFSLEGMSV